MEKDIVYYEKKNQVAWVYLNNEAEMNALSKALLTELIYIFQLLKEDKDTRVVVLTGIGKAFCAGANLKEILAERNRRNTENAQGFFTVAEECFQLLYSFPKPVIGALNGITLAGGLELALTADILIAAESTKIGDAHSNFGVVPGGGSSIKLARKIGENRAKYLLFSGEFLPAQKMKEYGLVHEVVVDEDLESTVMQLAEKLAEKSPVALSTMKEMMEDGYKKTFDEALKGEMEKLKAHIQTEDCIEGLRAFSEKRKPNFTGK
ncbi:enoyl-CoA hydratase/isomerase family protein [Psychrobacillus soli]|uniref:Enoyl-CoA hydratase/isomerase family protein n=1 Tax=Psychrobacillus soli TaxID=1543965 RepID=A0A544TM89_9BACI|nr:enoyl-CoA hydratase/isomerase family protein [Psychrobacillus soli]TQR18520.1 enoyl-CoA hydratase/isomerase family protein [Psychrobacillus soli]